MDKNVQARLDRLKDRAYDTLKLLLKSDNEQIRMRAAKLGAASRDKGHAKGLDGELIPVQDGLLKSEDEKIRMKVVELILGQKSAEKSGAKIVSPYERWFRSVHKKDGSRRKNCHNSTFRRYWFKKTGYVPHEPQRLIHLSDKRFIVCICGRRFGKTLLAAKEAEITLMQPDKRVWVVAPTYALCDKVFREVYADLVIKGNVPREAITKKSESERQIKFAWGSEVIGKSSDNPDSLLGEAVDLIIFDECAKASRQIWEKYLRPTLSDREGRAIFITTPEGTNWAYTLYKRGQKGVTDKRYRDWASFLFATESNPHISRDDIDEAKRTLPREVFNQEYMADFFTFSGKVYKDFTRAVHVFDK